MTVYLVCHSVLSFRYTGSTIIHGQNVDIAVYGHICLGQTCPLGRIHEYV